MATIRLVPSAYTRSNTSRVTVTDEANMYYNTDHTGSYASIRGRNNTSNTYYAFIHGFNFDDVPSNAVVNSFSVKIKAYRNTYLNTGTTYNPRLASSPSNSSEISNTTLSSALATGTTGAVYTFPNGSLTWEQVKGYGSNFSIEIPLRSTASQYPYAYVFGAEIEVNYTLPTPHDISVTNTSSNATVTPTGTETVIEGDDFSITITDISSLDDIIVTDNGVDVTSDLEEVHAGTYSPVFNPSGLEDHLAYNNGSVTNPQNACTDTGSTNYAEIRLGSNVAAFMTFAFDTSSIPDNAVINSVSCSAKVNVSNASNSISNKTVQLYAGSTAKGTAYTGFSTGTTPFNVTAGNSWTVNEVHNIKIKATATYSNTQNYTLRFYGANLTINYTVNGEGYVYTLSNITTDHDIIISPALETFVMTASSTYTAATIVPTTASVVQGDSITFNIENNGTSDIKVTDNNIDVTSQLVPAVGETGNSKVALGTFDESNSEYVGIYSNYVATNAQGKTAAQGMASTASTRSAFYPATGEGSVLKVVYNIPSSSVPNGAVVTNVSCSAVCSAAYTGQGYNYLSLQLYAGNTPKGAETEIVCENASANIFNVDGGDSWTNQELAQAKIVLYGIRNNTNSNNQNDGTRDNASFHGADLVVTYGYPANGYSYTITNVQTAHTIVVSEDTIRYNVVASSNYTGATITPSSSLVVEGESITLTINAANKYEIKVKDNGTDVTSSVTGSSNNYKYTISNIQAAHTIVVEEADYYTVTGSSTYTGATVNAPGKVYVGQTATVTVSVANKYEIVFKDNNVDKTSSLVGETTTLTYTLTNVQANHTIAVSEATNYTISTSSSYAGVTVTANPTKVYAGRSCTVTITGASKDTMVVKDNNTDITSSLVGSNNSYTYTLSNVTASHTITVTPITYTVTASSNFGSATITPTSSSVIKGNSITLTINAANTYSIKVTDNGVDVTSSITGSANNYKYTISNVTAAHTIVVNEAAYYNIYTANTYTGASISVPSKVYAGQSVTASVTVANTYEIIFKDNGVVKTLAGTSSPYTYTLTNVSSAHTFSITEATYYTISTSTTYAGVTITANPSKVYAGRSTTITISGKNKDTMIVKDNGTNVTSSLAGSNNSYTYTLSNVSANHTITVEPITYAVNASSTYASATIAPTASTVIKGESITLTIAAANTYSIKVTDNGTVVTGSITGSANNYKYTISNISAAHTIVVSEANKYSISTSSTYPGVTLTASPTTVYEGQSSTITVAGASLSHMIIRDNGAIITNSFTGSNNSYSYTLTNITTAHTLTVSPSATYNITASSTYSRTSISPTATTVVEGDSLTFTITGDTTAIKVTDNSVDVTASLVANGNTKTYTLTNITSAHTIAVSFVQTGFVKVGSSYVTGKKFYKKTAASTWTEMTLSEFHSYIQSNDVFYN